MSSAEDSIVRLLDRWQQQLAQLRAEIAAARQQQPPIDGGDPFAATNSRPRPPVFSNGPQEVEVEGFGQLLRRQNEQRRAGATFLRVDPLGPSNGAAGFSTSGFVHGGGSNEDDDEGFADPNFLVPTRPMYAASSLNQPSSSRFGAGAASASAPVFAFHTASAFDADPNGNEDPISALKWSSDKTQVWTDSGSGGIYSVAVYRMKLDKHPTYARLGDHAMPRGGNAPQKGTWAGPSHVGAALLAKKDSKWTAPLDYSTLERVWTDEKSGSHSDVSLWKGRPTANFRSTHTFVGVIAWFDYGKPPASIVAEYRCLHNDMLTKSPRADPVWTDNGTGAKRDVGFYMVPGTGLFTTRSVRVAFSTDVMTLKGDAHFPTLSRQEMAETLVKYAPEIRFHSEETYWPDKVDNTFAELRNAFQRPANKQLKLQLFTDKDHPQGANWLIVPLDSPSDDSHPYFKGCGGNVDQAATYAYWVERADIGVLDLVYYIYFPYNRGKRAADTIWGNHVGDWEHITVRCLIQPDRKVEPYVLSYAYHSDNHYPKWSEVDKEGTHPIAYCAKYSHGMHVRPGTFAYLSVKVPVVGTTVLELEDDTDEKGVRWRTWERGDLFCMDNSQLACTKYTPTGGFNHQEPYPKWMSAPLNSKDAIYRWGNKEQGSLFGAVARLEDGPEGPRDKSVMKKPRTFD